MKFNVMQITSGGRENDLCIGQVQADSKEEAVQYADKAFGGSAVYEANRPGARRDKMDGYSYIEIAK